MVTMRKKKRFLQTVCLSVGMMSLCLGEVSLAGHGNQTSKTYAESAETRIIFGTVDDVARNLVKVNKDKTEGITPRYLDLSEVDKKTSLQKGDRVKMKINNHNIVTDYWLVKDN